MGIYNVEFSGKLLAGFDRREVRLHAANRLRLSEAQLDRVFDGRPIVLKKQVDAVAGQRYLSELHRLGMASRLVPLEGEAPAEPVETFKVVFAGQVLPGFEPEAVAVAAARRLNIGPVQVEKLFSGRKAVLKRNISQRRGRRYVDELATLGMQASLVSESAPAAASAPVAAATAISVARVAGAVPDLDAAEGEGLPVQSAETQLAALTETQFDMPQALLASGDLPEPPEDAIDHAATLLVDPARLVERMNYLSSPPPEREPVADRPGLSLVDAAVPYVKCPQCAHAQPAGSSCRRCGADLDARPARQPAPDPAPVHAIAAASAESSSGLQLEPMIEAVPSDAPPAAEAPPAAAESLAAVHAEQAPPTGLPLLSGWRKLAVAAGVVGLVLVFFWLH